MCQSIWIVLILKTGRINKINKNLNRKKITSKFWDKNVED